MSKMPLHPSRDQESMGVLQTEAEWLSGFDVSARLGGVWQQRVGCGQKKVGMQNFLAGA